MNMYILIVSIWLVTEVNCYKSAASCDFCKTQYTRIKRAKYYSSGPPKYFKLPPMSSPVTGPFSYTPPPGYAINDVAPTSSSNLRPYKVSKSHNEGLGETDIRNIVKYLSKQDLNKIVELAVEKEKYSERYRTPSQDNYEHDQPNRYEQRPLYKDVDEDYDMKTFPYSKVNDEIKTNSFEYRRPANNPFQDDTQRILTRPNKPMNDQFINQQNPLEELTSLQDQATFLDAYIQKEMNGFRPDKFLNSDSIDQEEVTQKPSNLREQDYDVSYTNNVPRAVKADSSSYKLENFADLPLMNYDSKLDIVNSYNVPHYTVTQPRKPVRTVLPPLESAPQRTAQDQSDAHLMAIKIWTHKSKGTAYTLHEDGTLSLEPPSRPKFKF